MAEKEPRKLNDKEILKIRLDAIHDLIRDIVVDSNSRTYSDVQLPIMMMAYENMVEILMGVVNELKVLRRDVSKLVPQESDMKVPASEPVASEPVGPLSSAQLRSGAK